MIAYSRGSTCLAGAASLRNRMPAMIRAFTRLSEIAQPVEQQPDQLSARVRLPFSGNRCGKQR